MVMINRAAKEITLKIVYYGPGLCGKTTNLEFIYEKSNPEKRGKLLTVATETDRTLFFDFLPMELGRILGMKLRVQLYTVPGQVFYDATRRIVLRGSDGVVFVADSQKLMMDANLESLENLRKNLRLNNLDPEKIPLVLQYNKQDLPNLASNEDLEATLNWRHVPWFPAVATVGTGVNETVKKVIELVIRRLHEQEVTLRGGTKAQEAAPPAPAQTALPPVPAPLPPPPLSSPPPPPVPAEMALEEPVIERTAPIAGDEKARPALEEEVEVEMEVEGPDPAVEVEEAGERAPGFSGSGPGAADLGLESQDGMEIQADELAEPEEIPLEVVETSPEGEGAPQALDRRILSEIALYQDSLGEIELRLKALMIEVEELKTRMDDLRRGMGG